MIVFLDSSILGIVCTPGSRGETGDCKRWFEMLLARSARVVTSEICEYEVRRGLIETSLRQGRTVDGLQELDDLSQVTEFLPVTRNVLGVAAQIWANSRYQGKQMTGSERLDADSMICAHWKLLDEDNPGRRVVIASKNLRDLNRFAIADLWQNIRF